MKGRIRHGVEDFAEGASVGEEHSIVSADIFQNLNCEALQNTFKDLGHSLVCLRTT